MLRQIKERNSLAFNNSVNDKIRGRNGIGPKINVFPEGANFTWASRGLHVVGFSDLPEEMRLGQLFLQCPSDP